MRKQHKQTWRRFIVKQALRGLNVLEDGLNPIKKKLLQDSYYRFRSVDEVQWGGRAGVRIDANRATVDDWLRLPGISIHQARTLVGLSQSGIPFTGWEDVAAATGIGLDHLQRFSAVVQFYYYDPASSVRSQQLNVNGASVRELTVIPGVDSELAERLVYHRQRFGAYQGWLDLKNRLQLSPRMITALLHYLHF